MNSTCLRKRMFMDIKKAKWEAKKESRRANRPIYVYRCDCCPGWHLTHVSPHVQAILEEKKDQS